LAGLETLKGSAEAVPELPALPPEEEEEAASLTAPAGVDRSPQRATIYWVVLVLLLGGAFVLRTSPWRTGPQFHTLLESVATILAFVAGALALVRFYSRKQATFLFIGTGFLATGLLDGYHTLITSPIAPIRAGAAPEDISAWSWTASRVFLSLFLFVSLLAWRQEARESGPNVHEKSVYVTALILTALNFAFFSVLPLRDAYYPQFMFSRPAEFLPAVFFAWAFVGYLAKGTWRKDAFEHWLLVSLLISVLANAAFMSSARVPYDAMYDAAHLLKITSYVAVLCGLMISVYLTFRSEAEALTAIRAEEQATPASAGTAPAADLLIAEARQALGTVCPTCGPREESGAVFCSDCGRPLAA